MICHSKILSQRIRRRVFDEGGVAGIASMEPEIVAAYAMLGFEMADDGLDGGPAA